MTRRIGLCLLLSFGLAGFASAFSTADVVQVTFENNLGGDVNELFFSPADTVQWGADIMNTSDVLGAGTSVTFWVHPGDYDILAMTDAGGYMASGVSITKATRIGISKKTFTPTDMSDSADRITVTVVNKTGQTVRFLFISPADSGSWGPDVLRKGVNLTNGSSAQFNVMADPGNTLTYDLLAVNSSLATTWTATMTLKPGSSEYTMTLTK